MWSGGEQGRIHLAASRAISRRKEGREARVAQPPLPQALRPLFPRPPPHLHLTHTLDNSRAPIWPQLAAALLISTRHCGPRPSSAAQQAVTSAQLLLTHRLNPLTHSESGSGDICVGGSPAGVGG